MVYVVFCTLNKLENFVVRYGYKTEVLDKHRHKNAHFKFNVYERIRT